LDLEYWAVEPAWEPERELRIQVMRAGALVASLSGILACGSDGTGPSSPPPAGATTELLSVMPAGGSTGVSTTTNLVMTFDHTMMVGMEHYLDLHRGDASAPIEPIGCTWSSDRLTATCQPAEPLQRNSQYTFHAGGGMMDANDLPIDIGPHGTPMGGQWLMPGMMGGMHAGMPMSGMGAGWKAANGSYGMVFTFTTG
jgi:Bacterial Ig-like domain